MISEKASQIGTSPTLKIASKAKAMKAEGIDIVDLSVGEPDFPTPENVKAAGIKAIEQNYTKYTENEGIPPLKKAIIDRLREDFGLSYKPNEIIVSTGAKSSLFHLIQALVNEDEEVIIPAPYWVSYPHLVTLAKGKTVILPTKEENGFLLTAEQLRAAISPSTKALILNNPSNPTGAAYKREELEALAEVIREEDIYVMADEIYAKLVYDNFPFVSIASLGEDIQRKSILISGVSKSYSMTGWRIGFAAGPAEIISGMSKIQSHTTSNPVSISQKASLEALVGPQHEISKMVSEFQRRRNYVLMRLQSIPQISCFKPQGAFYTFPNVRAYYEKEFNGIQIRNSYGMAYYLLKEAKVAIVPGDSFGADNYIRISYATSMENLEKGMERITKALSQLTTAKKVQRIALNNAVTRVKKSIPVEASIDIKIRDGLVAEAEGILGFEKYFEWNANINGLIVQLRTNVPHLYDFWMENWFPAQLESGLEPHGIIYAVDGIPGREPRAFYNTETKTGVIFNSDNYGPLRSLALGLVMDASERLFGVHAIRGMSVDRGGSGLVLIGAPGTKKTELFFELLQDPEFRFHSNDIVFVRPSGKTFSADNVERKAYMPTNTVVLYPRLASLFDHSKGENIITHKEECRDAECQRQEDCRLDRGSPFCYRASKVAHSMLDPNWIGGPEAHVRHSVLRWVFLLRNDAISPPIERVNEEDALRILEAGESPGLKKEINVSKAQPFFNPHLLLTTPERLELQKAFFQKLLHSASFFLFNSGAAGADQIRQVIRGEIKL
ncbi:MAG: pyridoxal phosphate-dependent aminotransferase [Candidatus Aminicenantales bacterium]